MADFRNTLFLPFENGQINRPEPDSKWLFLNAQAGARAPHLPHLICEQRLRSEYLALKNAEAGVNTSFLPDQGEPTDCDGALVLASRVRKLNEWNVIRAWNALKSGGVLVFSGDKTSGVQPIRKWLGKRVEITGSLSKHHGVAFWTIKQGGNWPLPDHSVHVDGYTLEPGMFSANGIDKGSRLLVEHFDNRIFGRVADFGAGWGYLSGELIKRSNKIDTLELYEADWMSLEAAKKHIGDKADYHWSDLVSERPKGPFNWIVMNPPFHKGRAAEPELGQTFITQAAKALPAGGRLLMVANTNLPYERTLDSTFAKVERIAQTDGFKIIEAVKGSR